MTDTPFSASALRGAVDLSSLSRGAQRGTPATAAGRAAPSASGAAGAAPEGISPAGGYVVDATDATFQEVMNASMRHPVILVLWSSSLPQTQGFVDMLSGMAQRAEGRYLLARVDADANPGILRAFQAQSVPVTFALIQGQPVPLFEGVQDEATVQQVIDQLLQLAVQNGMTGRAEPAPGGPGDGQAEEGDEAEDEVHPLIERALAAIDMDDLDGAAEAYEAYLAEHPGDDEARLGLAQVGLMKRTQGVDLQEARATAAANPTDVPAQILVADLAVLGGHVEDAFVRLVDTVRDTTGDDRALAREHLLELFEVVGPQDPRVIAGRKALTSALF